MKFKEMNLPNKLTTIRMFCVPLMLVLFVLYMLYTKLNVPCDYTLFALDAHRYLNVTQVLMAVLFAFASITDFVDGHLARKHNIVSDYGKLMDPLADKLLVNTTIVSMMACGMYLIGSQSFLPLEILAMIASILVIARDIFVDALRMQALKKNAVVPAGIWGKLKTATLMPGIVFMILGSLHPVVFAIGLAFMTLGGIFALIGGVKYYVALSVYIGD